MDFLMLIGMFFDCDQEHFFSESNGQTGYIQDRLKRVRRSLSADSQQRPRKKLAQDAASKQADGEC